MSAYDPSFETTLSADLWAGSDPAAAIRATLGLPHALRFQGARCAMFTASVLLAVSPEARSSGMTGLKRAAQGFDDILDLLENWEQRRDLHPEARALFADILTADPQIVAGAAGYARSVHRAYDILDQGLAIPDGFFDGLMSDAYTIFHPSMLQLTERMATHGARRRDELEGAQARARNRALLARDKISSIARTVRLISLNARVEAARAGETGRAFGVIAQEIRNLSEETEAASDELGHGVDDMTSNFKAF